MIRLVRCGLYLLQLPNISIHSFSSNTPHCNALADAETWHNKLDRVSDSRKKSLHQLDPLIHSSFGLTCDTCHFAKDKCLSFRFSTSTTQACFNLVRVDILRPMHTPSMWSLVLFKHCR